MTRTWKLILAAIGIAGVVGLLAGYASGSSVPAPDVGEPVVLTPAPSSTAATRTLSPTPSATGKGGPVDNRGDDPGDIEDDDADDDRDDDIDHVDRTVRPWGEDPDDDDGADRGADEEDGGDDHGDD